MVHGSQKRTPNGAAPPTAGRVKNFAKHQADISVGNTKDDARHSRRNNNHKPTSVGTRREPAINAGSRIFTRIFTSHPTISTSQYNSLEKTERPYVNQPGRRRSYWTRVPITGNSSETEIFTYVEQALYRESRKTTTEMAEDEPTNRKPPTNTMENTTNSQTETRQARIRRA